MFCDKDRTWPRVIQTLGWCLFPVFLLTCGVGARGLREAGLAKGAPPPGATLHRFGPGVKATGRALCFPDERPPSQGPLRKPSRAQSPPPSRAACAASVPQEEAGLRWPGTWSSGSGSPSRLRGPRLAGENLEA